MKKPFQLTLLLLLYSLSPIQSGDIMALKVLNNQGVDIIQILEGTNLYLPNHWRPNKPNLKFSIYGGEIVEVKPLTNRETLLKFNDDTIATFTHENKTEDGVTEYTFHWAGGGLNEGREVCFHYGHNGASWYGAYQNRYADFPLNTTQISSKSDFSQVLLSNQLSVKAEYSSILEPLFINTDGFALLLDQKLPWLSERVFNHKDGEYCFTVNATHPYPEHILTERQFKDIKFHLFTAENIRNVADYIVIKSGLIPQPKEIPAEFYSNKPIFNLLSDWDEEKKISFGEKLYNLSLTPSEIVSQRIAHITTEKEYKLDQVHLPNLIQKLNKMNITFIPQLTNGYFYLTNSSERFEAFKFFNFTDPNSIDSARQLWARYMEEYNFKSIKLEHDFNQGYFTIDLNHYLLNSIKTAVELGINIKADFAFKTQNIPYILQLKEIAKEVDDETLPNTIPNLLAVSLAGYSFLAGSPLYPYEKEELFIRGLQLNALQPVMRFNFNYFTWEQDSPLRVEMLRKFIDLNREFQPLFLHLARKRIETGEPIFRPLWYLEPENPATYKINDQYMLGDDILVAPVLKIGQRERVVYFPPGIWLDQHGNEFVGGKEMIVEAPLEELPYFKRKM